MLVYHFVVGQVGVCDNLGLVGWFDYLCLIYFGRSSFSLFLLFP